RPLWAGRDHFLRTYDAMSKAWFWPRATLLAPTWRSAMPIRSWSRPILLLGLVLIIPRPASAVSVVEPIACTSWRAAPGTGSLGAGDAIGVGNLNIVPMLEYVFVDNSSDWAITVDGHMPVLPMPVLAIYAGAGITAYHHNPDQGDSSTDSGVNLLI